jgi:probable rRNA maturation factor
VWIANRQRGVAIDRQRLQRVSDFILAALGLEQAELSILLVSDRRMKQLNRQYLGRNRPTDVLAFAQWEGGGERLHPDCLGDVVISAETAERQAGRAGARLNQELDLLLVHGILHLIGYEHTCGHEEAVVMGNKQRQLLRRIRKRFPGGAQPDGKKREPTGRRIGRKEGF